MQDSPREAHAPSRVTAGVTFAARLAFEHIGHAFNAHRQTLCDVSFAAEPGEVLCLLGPSGSGKTTLLRIAAGIEPQTSGRVLLNDREIAGPVRLPAARAALDRPGVPGLRAVPASHHPRQRPLRPHRAVARGGAPRGAYRAFARRAGASREFLPACALRRRAAARGACPRARPAAGGAARWTNPSPASIPA